MVLLDANVLIRAFRADIEGQPVIRRWLEEQIASQSLFGFPEGILTSFIRIVTQKPFDPITPIEVALEFAEQVRSAPSCHIVAADPVQWTQFVEVCRRLRAHGRRAEDVYWASFALSHDAEWITFDQGFAQIPALRWRSPLDARARRNPV